MACRCQNYPYSDNLSKCTRTALEPLRAHNGCPEEIGSPKEIGLASQSRSRFAPGYSHRACKGRAPLGRLRKPLEIINRFSEAAKFPVKLFVHDCPLAYRANFLKERRSACRITSHGVGASKAGGAWTGRSLKPRGAILSVNTVRIARSLTPPIIWDAVRFGYGRLTAQNYFAMRTYPTFA